MSEPGKLTTSHLEPGRGVTLTPRPIPSSKFRDGHRFGSVPVAALAHIETSTVESHYRKLRERWDPRRVEPILLAVGDRGGIILLDGNHRLRAHREFGEPTIRAIVRLPRE